MSVFTEQPVSLQDSKLTQSIEIDDSFYELQSELLDSAYVATTSDGKTVIVPQVQSMKEYMQDEISVWMQEKDVLTGTQRRHGFNDRRYIVIFA